MINLLPRDIKQRFIFARRNNFIIRYLVACGVGLIVIALVITASFIFLRQEAKSYQDSITASETELASQNEKQTIARVQEISNSLNLVVNVLSQEVLFSKLLRQVGAAMPSGTVLQGLSLSNELSGAIDLQAGAADYNSASQVQINLQDSKNRIFDTADLISISCDGDDPAYPCTVRLRAQFAEDNDFMLLSKDRT